MTYPLANPDRTRRLAGKLLLVGAARPPGLPAGIRSLPFRAEAPPRAGDVAAALVAGDGVDAPFRAWLAQPAQAGLPLIVLAGEADADAVGTLLEARILAFLPPDADAAAVEAVLDQLAEGRSVGDMRGRYALDWPPPPPPGTVEGRPVDAARIRAHIKARRLRERYFPAGLFADPAWDILLDLAAARLEGRLVSVSSLCIAAAVPTTTALRWIKNMVDQGLLLRTDDRHDARRAFITLAPATANQLDACLAACFNIPGL